MLTQGDNQEPHVVDPIRGLVGQLGDEELQDGTQVALPSHCCHLDWPWHGGVTVTAGERERRREGGMGGRGTGGRVG